MTEEVWKKTYRILFDLYSGVYTAHNTKCKIPCSEIEYEVFHRSTDSKKSKLVILLNQRFELPFYSVKTKTP